MMARCCNVKCGQFPQYGGRGIAVCERWLGDTGFGNFAKDMGKRPPGRTLDRIDVNGNYEPGNCRWATAKEQSMNRRPLKIDETNAMQIRWLVLEAGYSKAAVARAFGIGHATVRNVVNNGWNGIGAGFSHAA